MIHAMDRDRKSHSDSIDRYDSDYICPRKLEEQRAKNWHDPSNLARGCDRDGKTLLDGVNGYLIECETLINNREKPYQPRTLEQHRAAYDAGLISNRPAKGELDWEYFHEPDPLTNLEFEALLVTLAGDPEKRSALKAVLSEVVE